jgi:DNA-binding CsgD family transcriptional regulator
MHPCVSTTNKPYLVFSSTASTLTDNGFDRIVSSLYDAATGGCLWRTALDPIQQLFGARAVVLHTTDVVDGRLLSLEFGGPDLERVGYDYVANWERHDPRKQRVLKAGIAAVGQWLHCHEAHDDNFKRHNAFYRHFMAAAEARENSLRLIGLDERTVTVFALELHASRGRLDADERELANRLGLHMERALQGHNRVRRLAAQSLVGHHLLEAFPYPMWLLSPDRGIQYATEAALALERSEVLVRRDQSRLRLARAGEDRQLSVLMHEVLHSAHQTRQHLRLGAGTSDAPAWLHLRLLDPAQVMGHAFGPGRCVLATLFRPSQVSALDPFALAEIFDLTPAEARIAALLGEGLEPAAIAERLNVRLSTVRTHIRQVLEALGQKRMTDVVRVLRQGEALWSSTATARSGPAAPGG